jgi:hypothetical protein
MIRLSLNGEELALTFKHNRYSQPQTNILGTPNRPVSAVTYAYIFGLDGEKKMNKKDVRANGIAFCSSFDNFCKETGRRVALSKAVSRWPRDVRKQVFGMYDSRRRG